MSEREYDVVIVGARCAGASLATFLARKGCSVLLVDRDPMPSDHVLCTHAIHAGGMAVLDELGVGDSVRSGSPPTLRARIQHGAEQVDLRFPEDRPSYCPRRARLDGILQRSAVEAGARFLDRARVESLLLVTCTCPTRLAARGGPRIVATT